MLNPSHCVQGDGLRTGSMMAPCVDILKDELYRKYTTKFGLALKDSVHE